MRIWMSSMLIIGISVLVLSSMNVSAETVTDGTGDIYHWYWNADSGTFGWQVTADEKPNINIKELTFSTSGDIATFTMTVDGIIEDSEFVSYWATYTSGENIVYLFTYINGVAGGMASNADTTQFDMEADSTVVGDTLTIMFDSVGEGTSDVEFHGYAYTWTESGGVSGESWWDYAPDTYFEGDISDDDTGGDDTSGDDTGGDGNGDGGTPSPPSGTPGFETLAVIAALGVALIILRRRK